MKKTALSRIVELCEQMGGLVDDLLFIARSERGKPELNISAFPLCEVLFTVIKQIEPVVSENKVKIQLQCNQDNIIDADPKRIKQLFTIFIDNAIKYSNPGSVVKIVIDARTKDKKNYADVKIIDTGIGMTEDELEQSNVRFFRGARAKLKNKKGMGLGLAIARAIMQAHNINYEIDSSLNHGTTILVSFCLDSNLVENPQSQALN